MNAERPLRILHLEDSADDAELIRERLIATGLAVQIDWAGNEEDFTSFLRHGGYDLILADYRLPGFAASAAVLLTRSLCPGVPFIAVTGAVGDEKAIELIKLYPLSKHVLRSMNKRRAISHRAGMIFS